MQSFTILKGFLFSCLIAYFVIGISARIYKLPQEEIFPIYSWSLFSTVPNTVYRYDVQLISYKGIPIKAPPLYRDAEGFVPNPHHISVYITIQAWGKAVERKNDVEAQKQREIFEALHLFPGTTYRLTKLKYDPIERWEHNTIQVTQLAEFTKH